MARKTVLERHQISGEGGRELPPPPTIIERNEPANVPSRSSSDGKGGTVILIAGTLFLGYLYFTRRLQGVIKAIQSPSSLQSKISGIQGIPPATPNPNIGTVPINPSGGYPRNFTIHFQPPYQDRPPVEISAGDRATCYAFVYSATFQSTGSPALAAIYAQRYCQ